MTYYVLFVMELATRKVVCAGVTPYPNFRLDAADRTQPHRCIQRVSTRKAVSNHGSRQCVPCSLPRDVRTGRGQVRAHATSLAKLNAHIERIHGSFKRECGRTDYLPRRRSSAPDNRRVSRIQSPRAKHQGLTGNLIVPGKGKWFAERKCSLSATTWRNAQSLRSRSCVNDFNIWKTRAPNAPNEVRAVQLTVERRQVSTASARQSGV